MSKSKLLDSSSDHACNWIARKDPKSGRTYYTNGKSGENTWTKPLVLASPEERESLIRNRQDARDFFEAMEKNIKLKFESEDRHRSAEFTNLLTIYESSYDELDSKTSSPPSLQFHLNGDMSGSFGGMNSRSAGTRIVRTISSIEDDLVDILEYDRNRNQYDEKATVNRSAKGGDSNYPLSIQLHLRDLIAPSESKPTSRSPSDATRENKLQGDLLRQYPNDTSNFYIADSKDSLDSAGFDMNFYDSHRIILDTDTRKRCNSTGTLYVANTMSAQDNEATIKCVCVVIRAHMIEGVRKCIVPAAEFNVFRDRSVGMNTYPDQVPPLDDVYNFFSLVFSKSQLESECIIMALIYCERLVKCTDGMLCIRYDNWKSMLFACLVMASKVWDDLSMWNVDFSQVCSTFDLQRVNTLELAVLDALKYEVKVSSSEYAKYYFHLRSMMARLGLSTGITHNSIKPLDLNGARKLQLATERYEADKRKNKGYVENENLLGDRLHCIRRNHSYDEILRGAHYQSVGLEQVVHSDHVDADGLKHNTTRRIGADASFSKTEPQHARRQFDPSNIPPPVTRARSDGSSYFRSVTQAATMPTSAQSKEDFKGLSLRIGHK